MKKKNKTQLFKVLNKNTNDFNDSEKCNAMIVILLIMNNVMKILTGEMCFEYKKS